MARNQLPQVWIELEEDHEAEALLEKFGAKQQMRCQPLDNFLSHVPDVEARRIVRTAPGIEKRWGP